MLRLDKAQGQSHLEWMQLIVLLITSFYDIFHPKGLIHAIYNFAL